MINSWASMQKALAIGADPNQAWFSCSVNKSLNSMLDR
jgi:hypothetical protein